MEIWNVLQTAPFAQHLVNSSVTWLEGQASPSTTIPEDLPGYQEGMDVVQASISRWQRVTAIRIHQSAQKTQLSAGIPSRWAAQVGIDFYFGKDSFGPETALTALVLGFFDYLIQNPELIPQLPTVSVTRSRQVLTSRNVRFPFDNINFQTNFDIKTLFYLYYLYFANHEKKPHKINFYDTHSSTIGIETSPRLFIPRNEPDLVDNHFHWGRCDFVDFDNFPDILKAAYSQNPNMALSHKLSITCDATKNFLTKLSDGQSRQFADEFAKEYTREEILSVAEFISEAKRHALWQWALSQQLEA